MINLFRNWISEHPIGGLATLGILALVSIYLAVSATRSSRHPADQEWHAGTGQAYYYDTVDKKLFVDVKGKSTPFENEAGHPCYLAICYACGDCTEQNRFIAYLQKGSGSTAEIALPEDPLNWVPQFSDHSRPIMEGLIGKCAQGRLTPCLPKNAPQGQ